LKATGWLPGKLLKSVPSDIQTGLKVDSGRPVLVATMMVNLAIAFMSSALNISLPSLNGDFQGDPVSLTWVVTGYVLAIATFSVPSSRIADIIGRRKVFLWGTIIYTLMSAVNMLSISIGMLIAGRFIQGAASGMMQGTSTAMLIASYPASRRGRMLGLAAASIFFGQSAGPVIGGLLTQYFSWRSIFVVSVVTGLALIAITLWKVKREWVEARGARFDYRGSSVWCVSLVALIYGLSLLPDIKGAVIAGIGLIAVFIFIKLESSEPSPMLDIKLFRHNRLFVFSNLSAVIVSCSSFALMLLLSIYLQYVKGLSPEKAGLIFLLLPVTQAILSPVAGRLSDRVEHRIVATSGTAFLLVGIFFLIFFNRDTSFSLICIVLAIVGIGLALFATPNTNSIMSSVAPRNYAVAASLANTMRTLGSNFSLSITMITFAVVIGRVSFTAEYADEFLTSTRIIYSIFVVLCLFGIFISFGRQGKKVGLNIIEN
jgi:EmrB/QacA subfamily drug resistance transporter